MTTTSVVGVESVGPDAVAITIETPAAFDAAPGQFVSLSLPDHEESRFYTVSSPRVADSFEVTLSIDPDGTLAPTLAALEAGDQVVVEGPFGETYYDGAASVAVLAGGPGVGPAIAVAERALDEGGSASLVYRDETPIHRDRLDALADRASVWLLDPEDDLEDAIAAALADDPDVVFVYGFETFVEDVKSAIASIGADPADLRVESFG